MIRPAAIFVILAIIIMVATIFAIIFFKIYFILFYLLALYFIFGSAGSSMLHVDFLQLQRAGATFVAGSRHVSICSCDAQVSLSMA